MIEIVIKDNSIKLKGHANYDQKGKDIVCAAVSAIIQSSVTWFKAKDIKYVENSKIPLIELTLINKNEDNINKLELLIKQLKFIQKHYSKNIKIRR